MHIFVYITEILTYLCKFVERNKHKQRSGLLFSVRFYLTCEYYSQTTCDYCYFSKNYLPLLLGTTKQSSDFAIKCFSLLYCWCVCRRMNKAYFLWFVKFSVIIRSNIGITILFLIMYLIMDFEFIIT